MKAENIEALDVYWYVTHDMNNNDCPSEVEKELLQIYAGFYVQLPRWKKI